MSSIPQNTQQNSPALAFFTENRYTLPCYYLISKSSMAHRKAGGSAKNLTDSNPQYLGVKLSDGQKASIGDIIVRQRGTNVMAGNNVGVGKDHTLFALAEGKVKFSTKRKTTFTGEATKRKQVDIV